MDTILEILETIKPGADFAASTDFIEEHLLESMEVLQLVSELNDEFDINITLPYIKPENFKSVESIYHMVQEILEDEQVRICSIIHGSIFFRFLAEV